MIRNFETETAPLSDAELRDACLFREELKHHVGIAKAITGAALAKKVTGKDMHGARVRKIVNHLRLTTNPNICAASNGYFLAISAVELEDNLKGLTERIAAQQAILNAQQRYYNERVNQNQQKIAL